MSAAVTDGLILLTAVAAAVAASAVATIYVVWPRIYQKVFTTTLGQDDWMKLCMVYHMRDHGWLPPRIRVWGVVYTQDPRVRRFAAYQTRMFELEAARPSLPTIVYQRRRAQLDKSLTQEERALLALSATKEE